ncbi:LemA family protein [Porphyromonas gingivalis]|uniref:LemA family protein n=1 Tax=Porphyromonas gingivalis TaxID=837 RepID=UPI000B4E4D03|nr:LemA family protein [Porphyromonas gingivalis]OWR78115.1 LemA family protein [Porphyromonas gingivalis SJD4]
MDMKKGTVTIIAIIAVFVLLFSWGVLKYNGFVDKQEAVNTAWSQVENQYQRRLDLIPNLVETVKGYAAHESETLTAVIEARSKATAANINADNLTEENLAKFQQSQDQLSSALSRLMVVVERYPDLKANQNFRDLQVQLEGTENRITVARQDFNAIAKTYNVAVRRFPANIIAGMMNFDQRPYFKADEGAEKAPQVKF